MDHGADALREGRIAALAQKRPQIRAALLEVGKDLLRARAGLLVVDGLGELVEMHAGELSHQRAKLGYRVRLDAVHEVRDVFVVRVERATRDARAAGHGGHRDAGEVARGGYLLRKRIAEREPRAARATVRDLRGIACCRRDLADGLAQALASISSHSEN